MKLRASNPFHSRIATLAVLFVAPFAHAADGTWNGISGNWTDTTDPGGVWVGGIIADGTGFNANFTGIDILSDLSIALNGNRTIGNITFTDDTTSSNNLAITGNILTLDVASGVPVIDVTQAGRTLGISSVVSGNDGLQKNGAGTLILTGANNYSGGTTINAGTLQVGDGGTTGALGSGNIVNNGTLAYNFNSASTVSLPSGAAITGSGNLSATAGVIRFNGNITQGGALSFTQVGTTALYKGLELVAPSTTLTASSITLSGDVGKTGSDGNSLALNTSASNGTINLDISLGRDGTWYIPSAFSANAGTGAINITGSGLNDTGWRNTPVTLTGAVIMTGNVNSSASVTIDSNTTTTGLVTGVFSGGMPLTKSGTGTLTLSGANTYTGTTTISGGTLQIGNGGATGSLYSPVVSGSGNLTYASAGSIVNNSALVYNMVGGSVNVNQTISGSGTVSVTGNQRVNFANGTAINTAGSQTYSATATSGRYNGYTIADSASVALTSSAGNISMTGMLGTANGNTGSLNVNTSAGNGNVTLNVAVGQSGINYGMNSISVNAGTGTISLGVFNGQVWNQATTISLTGGAVNSTVNKGSFTNLNVTNSGASLFSGTISGSGALTKSGAGTLTLSAQNSFIGALTINGGVVEFSNNDNVGRNVFGSTQININNGATLRVSGALGNIEIFKGRTYTFDSAGGGSILLGTGNYNATTTAFGITTNGGARNNIGLITTSGAFGFNLGSAVATFNVALGTDATSDLTITPIIANGGSIVKSGTGRLTLTAANTYSGATTVNNGTLVLQNTYASSGFGIASGAVLELNVAGGSRSYATTTFSGAGTLQKTGGGEALWGTTSGVFALGSGAMIDVKGGSFVGGSNANENWTNNLADLNVDSGAFFSGVEANVRVDALTGAGTISSGYSGAGYLQFTFGVDNGNGTFSGVLANGVATGNFTKAGSGNQTLSNTNTYTGVTTVTGGTLTLGHATNTLANGGAVNVNGGTLALGTNTDTVGAVTLTSGSITGTGTGRLTGTGSAYDVRSGTIDAKLGGTVGLNKTTAGTVTINSDNSSGGYTGATSVSAGTLLINGNISTSITTVSGTGTLGGSGTLGTVTVQAGGTLAPGNSIGTLNFTNTLSLAGVSNFEIDPLLGLGLNADLANVTNGVTYGGTLNVLYGGSSSNFANGMVFNLFDAASFSGSFIAVNLPTLDGGLTWQNDLLSNGSLTVIPEPNVAALLGSLALLTLLRRRRN